MVVFFFFGLFRTVWTSLSMYFSFTFVSYFLFKDACDDALVLIKQKKSHIIFARCLHFLGFALIKYLFGCLDFFCSPLATIFYLYGINDNLLNCNAVIIIFVMQFERKLTMDWM